MYKLNPSVYKWDLPDTYSHHSLRLLCLRHPAPAAPLGTSVPAGAVCLAVSTARKNMQFLSSANELICQQCTALGSLTHFYQVMTTMQQFS